MRDEMFKDKCTEYKGRIGTASGYLVRMWFAKSMGPLLVGARLMKFDGRLALYLIRFAPGVLKL